MSSVIQYPFTTPSNYTYDSSLIDIAVGKAELRDRRKDIEDGSALFYHSGNSTLTANWGNGSTAMTVVSGNPVIDTVNKKFGAGSIDLTTTKSAIRTTDAANYNFGQTGTIDFWLQPTWTGTPPGNVMLAHFGNYSTANAILISTSASTNRLFLSLYNSSSVSQPSLQWANPMHYTNGVWQHIRIVFDIGSGGSGVTVYNDGVNIGTKASNYSRTSPQHLTIGGDNTLTAHRIDDFIVFDSALGAPSVPTAEYVQTIYHNTNPIITVNSTFLASELLTIGATEIKAGSDEIKYIENVGGQDRYVVGGTAADSDGTYSQSSTLSEMSSDITGIIAGRKLVETKIFLHSTDGSTTPQLDVLDFTYDSSLVAPTTALLSLIEGYFYDTNGPLANQTVKVRPFERGFWNQGVFHTYAFETIGTTDSDGYFFGTLYVQPTGEYWEIKVGTQSYQLAIQNLIQQDLKDAPTWEVITI